MIIRSIMAGLGLTGITTSGVVARNIFRASANGLTKDIFINAAKGTFTRGGATGFLGTLKNLAFKMEGFTGGKTAEFLGNLAARFGKPGLFSPLINQLGSGVKLWQAGAASTAIAGIGFSAFKLAGKLFKAPSVVKTGTSFISGTGAAITAGIAGLLLWGKQIAKATVEAIS